MELSFKWQWLREVDDRRKTKELRLATDPVASHFVKGSVFLGVSAARDRASGRGVRVRVASDPQWYISAVAAWDSLSLEEQRCLVPHLDCTDRKKILDTLQAFWPQKDASGAYKRDLRSTPVIVFDIVVLTAEEVDHAAVSGRPPSVCDDARRDRLVSPTRMRSREMSPALSTSPPPTPSGVPPAEFSSMADSTHLARFGSKSLRQSIRSHRLSRLL